MKKNSKKIIVFLGASIGNFSIKETVKFLKEVSRKMTPQDVFMIGFEVVENLLDSKMHFADSLWKIK